MKSHVYHACLSLEERSVKVSLLHDAVVFLGERTHIHYLLLASSSLMAVFGHLACYFPEQNLFCSLSQIILSKCFILLQRGMNSTGISLPPCCSALHDRQAMSHREKTCCLIRKATISGSVSTSKKTRTLLVGSSVWASQPVPDFC